MTPSEPSYREIPLTKGQVAIVSAHRFEYLSQFKWYAFIAKSKYTTKWYASRVEKIPGRKPKTILMHREILGLTCKGVQGDHINGNGLDNRDENIRPCSVSQNAINRWFDPSGRGIRKYRSRWGVRIRSGRKEYHVGYFDTEHDAQVAYAVAAKIIHGDFRHTSLQEFTEDLLFPEPDLQH